eukprot:359093-Chlamydomonas_euryale.AAC.4
MPASQQAAVPVSRSEGGPTGPRGKQAASLQPRVGRRPQTGPPGKQAASLRLRVGCASAPDTHLASSSLHVPRSLHAPHLLVTGDCCKGRMIWAHVCVFACVFVHDGGPSLMTKDGRSSFLDDAGSSSSGTFGKQKTVSKRASEVPVMR